MKAISLAAMSLLWMLIVCAVGCSDDGSKPNPDQAQVSDTGPTADAPGHTEGSITGDQGPKPGDSGGSNLDWGTNLPCGKIGLCSEACGKLCPGGLAKMACLLKCSSDCRALGCASAKPLFDTLQTCVQSKCILQCGGGPSTGCTTCVLAQCASQTAACNSHTC